MVRQHLVGDVLVGQVLLVVARQRLRDAVVAARRRVLQGRVAPGVPPVHDLPPDGAPQHDREALDVADLGQVMDDGVARRRRLLQRRVVDLAEERLEVAAVRVEQLVPIAARGLCGNQPVRRVHPTILH